MIPDQALSIRIILERFSRGQSIPKGKTPIYSEEDFSNLERMDTFEKLDLLNQTNQFIQQTQNELQNPPTSSTSQTASAGSEPQVSAPSEPVA